MTRYDRLPEHMQDAAKRYVEKGVKPGGFLQAVLSNSLYEAFAAADHINSEEMKEWVSWLYYECPSPAWGSKEAVNGWITGGGLEGLALARARGEG